MYIVVAVLLSVGDQLPVIELLDVVGKADIVSPEQIAGIDVNVGIVPKLLTEIVKVVVFAH